MTSIIPEKYRAYFGTVLTLAVGVLLAMTEWQDLGPEVKKWIPRALGLTVLVSNVFGFKMPLPKLRGGGAAALLIVGLTVIATACAGGLI